mgnify:FL=1
MKQTKYKPFDTAWHFANKIGQMFYMFRDHFTYALELQDRKAAKEFGLGKYTMVRIDDNHTRDKDKYHYEITLFNRNYEPVPMMKIPDEAWIGLYNYFVELYTRWENSSGCRAY